MHWPCVGSARRKGKEKKDAQISLGREDDADAAEAEDLSRLTSATSLSAGMERWKRQRMKRFEVDSQLEGDKEYLCVKAVPSFV